MTGFSMLQNLLSMRLAPILTEMVRAYQAIAHTPLRAIVTAFGIPAPPNWAMDALVLWLLLGGVVLRTAWTARANALKAKSRSGGSSHKLWNTLISDPKAGAAFIAFNLLAWPYAVVLLLKHPCVHRTVQTGKDPLLTFYNERLPPGEYAWFARGRSGTTEHTYLYDLRAVLATQGAAAIGGTVGWFLLNAMIKLYG